MGDRTHIEMCRDDGRSPRPFSLVSNNDHPMTWDLEELGDEVVTLRREDGLVLTATRGEASPDDGGRTGEAVPWRFTVADEDGERLADHGWEIVDEEHLWEVLDGFTYRFRRDRADEDDRTGESCEDQTGDGTSADDQTEGANENLDERTEGARDD